MPTNIELYKGLKITDPPPSRDGGELIIDNFKYIADNLEILNNDYVSKSDVTQTINGKKIFSDLNVNYLTPGEILTVNSGKIENSGKLITNVVDTVYVDGISAYLQHQIDAIVLSGGVSNFLQLTDSPDSYVGQAGKAVLVKSDQTGLEFAQVGDPYLRSEVSSITANFNIRLNDLEANPIPDIFRTEIQGISGYLQNEINDLQGQINAIPLSDYTLRTESADISGYLQNQINQIEQESTIVLGQNGISVIQSPSQTFTVSVSASYVETSYLQAISGSLITLQNAYNNGNTINLFDARSFVITTSGGLNGLTVQANGQITADGDIATNGSLFVDDSFDVDGIIKSVQVDNGSINDNSIYLYNNTVLGDVTNDSITYSSHLISDEINARTNFAYEQIIGTRQVFYGTVINSPTSGQQKYDDFVIYNDNAGNLKFDKCNYASTTTRDSNRDYENILTLFGPTVISVPGYYDFSNNLGPFGRRLKDSDNYRNWTLSSPTLTGEDRDFLRVEPPDSPFTQGYYNCGVKGDASQRGIGVYTTGGGAAASILFDVYITGTEFFLDCDVVAAWNRFAASESLRYAGFEFRISGSADAQYARVDNTGISLSQARMWLTDTTAPSSAKSHFSHTWTGLTPGVHTVTIKYDNGSSSIIPPPSGMTRGTNMRNINVAVYNLLTNSSYPIEATKSYRGIQTPNVYVTSLSASPSGNFITWNGDGRLINSGISSLTIGTLITKSEVSQISGYLQNQINTIPLSAYTTRTETANISAYLDNKINVTEQNLISYTNSASANSYNQSVSYVNGLLPRSYINGVISTSVIDTVAISAINSANWLVSISGSSGLRTSNMLAITDGLNVEYAESSTPDIGSTTNLDLIADINAGYLRLVALAAAGTWNVKSTRISI